MLDVFTAVKAGKEVYVPDATNAEAGGVSGYSTVVLSTVGDLIIYIYMRTCSSLLEMCRDGLDPLLEGR